MKQSALNKLRIISKFLSSAQFLLGFGAILLLAHVAAYFVQFDVSPIFNSFALTIIVLSLGMNEQLDVMLAAGEEKQKLAYEAKRPITSPRQLPELLNNKDIILQMVSDVAISRFEDTFYLSTTISGHQFIETGKAPTSTGHLETIVSSFSQLAEAKACLNTLFDLVEDTYIECIQPLKKQLMSKQKEECDMLNIMFSMVQFATQSNVESMFDLNKSSEGGSLPNEIMNRIVKAVYISDHAERKAWFDNIEERLASIHSDEYHDIRVMKNSEVSGAITEAKRKLSVAHEGEFKHSFDTDIFTEYLKTGERKEWFTDNFCLSLSPFEFDDHYSSSDLNDTEGLDCQRAKYINYININDKSLKCELLLKRDSNRNDVDISLCPDQENFALLQLLNDDSEADSGKEIEDAELLSKVQEFYGSEHTLTLHDVQGLVVMLVQTHIGAAVTFYAQFNTLNAGLIEKVGGEK